jgi:hypothetical protein
MGYFGVFRAIQDNDSWTPDRSFWHLDSRMAIWRHWPGSVLGAPSWVDIPDSIRRDMKSQDPSWGTPDRTSRIPYAGT